MTKIIPLSEARQTLASLVTGMRKMRNRPIITRKGKREPVLKMGLDEYASWVETLELVSRPEAVKGLREGLADLEAGRSKSFEEVFGEPLHGKGKRR